MRPGALATVRPCLRALPLRGQHEPGVAERDGDADARRHQQPAASRSDHAVLAGPQVEPGIARVRVAGQRQSGSSCTIATASIRPAYAARSTPDRPPAEPAPASADGAMSDAGPSARWTGPVRSGGDAGRPPSVDRLARAMAAASGLPHAVCVELARDGDRRRAGRVRRGRHRARAADFHRTLLSPVINATGVLLHTNLGRAPVAFTHPPQAINVEFDLNTGERGSRQQAVGGLLATLCGAEAAMVVNNNAAAVLLVLAALAHDRQVLVSRGESVEIGGGFRVPEVMEQSGAHLVDVGTTNRTRLSDYSKALARKNADVALILKVHPQQLPHRRLRRGHAGRAAGDAGRAGRRRHRQRPDRRQLSVAGRPAARLVGRRACGPTDARRRRSTRDVQRRQADGRPAGRHHRRARRPRRRVHEAPAGPRPAARRARAVRDATTCAVVPRRRLRRPTCRSGRWPAPPSTTCRIRAHELVAALASARSCPAKRCPARARTRHRHPVGGDPRRRRSPRRTARARPHRSSPAPATAPRCSTCAPCTRPTTAHLAARVAACTMRVVATAGHVDHGKSSLVQALTGTNPDRFEEERAAA